MNKHLINNSTPNLSVLLVVLLMLNSCNSSQEKESINSLVIPSDRLQEIIALKDTTQSYIVYLPSNYNRLATYPIIFFFDPHGNGNLALNKALQTNKSHSYILVGSNNSKNGLTTLDYTLDVLLDDVYSKYRIDTNRMYAAGFSGGGRVANYMAIKYRTVKGIMTCGAGINNLSSLPASKRFDIYAVAGKGDFNYGEVQSMKINIKNAGWNCLVAEFNGGHEWPPASIFSEAILFFELNTLKENQNIKKKDFVKTCSDSIYKNCKLLYKNNQYLSAADECNKAMILFKGLQNPLRFKKLKREILKDKDYKEALANRNNILQQEQSIKNKYMQDIMAKDTNWWKNEVRKINSSIASDNNSEYANMQSRIKGFLGILCYSIATRSFAENNLKVAQKCIPVYEIIEPENEECQKYKIKLQKMMLAN